MDEVFAQKRKDTFLESRHLTNERLGVYLALEELDFVWSTKQVEEFDNLWSEGMSLKNISLYFNRDIDELAILLIDRARKGKAKQRRYGIHDH